MSLIPVFEIGLWNAWIFIIPIVFMLILQFRVTGVRDPEAVTLGNLNKKEKRLFTILQFIFFIAILYNIFLPLKLGTAWFYTGLTIYLSGIIIATNAVLNFTTAPKDKPVIEGIYHISRNPMYAGWILMYIGIAIACASWIYLLLTVILVLLFDMILDTEERECIEKYGDTYIEYVNRTPRWIGIPKSEDAK